MPSPKTASGDPHPEYLVHGLGQDEQTEQPPHGNEHGEPTDPDRRLGAMVDNAALRLGNRAAHRGPASI